MFLFICCNCTILNAQELTVDSIVISGNTITKNAIILREIPFYIGQTINNDSLSVKANIARNQLVNLNLFNQVDLSIDSIDKGIIVRIVVVEKWYFWPIPTFEFADRNFNQWWDFNFDKKRINYGLYNFLYNVGGVNHTLKLSLIAGYTKNIAVEYRIPYLNKKRKLGIAAGVAHKASHELVYITQNNKQQFYNNIDSLVNKRLLGFVELNYRPGLFYFHKLFGTLMQQQLHKEIAFLNPNYADGKSTIKHLQIGYQLLFKKVDNRFYPTQGSIISAVAASNFATTNSTFFWSDINLLLENYKHLNKHFNFGFTVNARATTIKSNQYPFNAALGYKQFVRGYESYVIDGQHYFLLKSSIRYELLNQKLLKTNFLPLKAYKKTICSSFLTFFVDGGCVKGGAIAKSFDNNLTNSALIGVGIGWDWVFYYDKVIRFEYSINKDNQKGLYIHFTKPL